MPSRNPFGWGDLLVGVILTLLFGSAGICAIAANWDHANLIKCASNLRQIGLTLQLYEADNRQLFPQTPGDEVADPAPVWGTPYQINPKLGPQKNADSFTIGKTTPAANDVTASIFLLLRNTSIEPAAFICPFTRARAWNFGGEAHTAQDWTNWDGNLGLARHLSYSVQNPFLSQAAIQGGFTLKNLDVAFAVAADLNPGGSAVATVTVRSSAEEMRKANSLNHGGEGQNVLYADGHVEAQSSPFAGLQHDNIYTAGGPEIQAAERSAARVAASSVSGTDSILLPTAADIGVKQRLAGGDQPLTPEQRSKLTAAICGRYRAVGEGVEATMTIDQKAITYLFNGATVKLDYQVIGGTGKTLVVNLTDPQTGKRERATAELDDGEIEFSTARGTVNQVLGFEWKRVLLE